MSENCKLDRNSPVWKLRELERTRRQTMDAFFAGMPLQKPAQHFLLFVIERLCDQEGAPSQGDIAQALHLSPATITASLRLLERYGFIRRRPDETDQRKNRVEITAEGREMAERCRVSMDTLEGAMFRGFTGEELANLSACFERMCKNLNSLIKEDKLP